MVFSGIHETSPLKLSKSRFTSKIIQRLEDCHNRAPHFVVFWLNDTTKRSPEQCQYIVSISWLSYFVKINFVLWTFNSLENNDINIVLAQNSTIFISIAKLSYERKKENLFTHSTQIHLTITITHWMSAIILKRC